MSRIISLRFALADYVVHGAVLQFSCLSHTRNTLLFYFLLALSSVPRGVRLANRAVAPCPEGLRRH
ncbi:MAG: hypothetical protein MZU97_08085 [Bacillus subtilis]|nr:hypothetical protein [Bacillus subtilis]